MRISYLLLCMLALFTACTGEKNQKSINEFTLTGKFVDAVNDGKQVYLQIKDAKTGEYLSIDTTTVANGSFAFSGINDNPEIRFVSSENMSKPALFVAEQGAVEMLIDSASVSTIKGTILNDKYQGYVDARSSFSNKMKEISQLSRDAEENNTITPEYLAELEISFDSVYNDSKLYVFSFVKENVNNVVGEYVFLDRGVSFDEKQLGELIPQMNNTLKENPNFSKIERRYVALKSTNVGQNYVNLTGNTPDGKEISLSDFVGKNKYVLVDFWASWCPPCRSEMPKVVSLYNQYKDKGFEIVGVSLDDEADKWKKGIKDLNITWAQMSDLKGWDSDLSNAYAINSIPHMVLIDKDGKIIARGFSVEELSAKLKELFSK